MVVEGGQYLCNKDGWLRMGIIACGIIAFALVASSGYGGSATWPFVAYLMSWLISFMSFFYILTSLSTKMECGVPYDTVDVCLSILLFAFCLFGSIVLAVTIQCYGIYDYADGCGDNGGERIAATIFGFIAAILYVIEIYLHQDDAPAPTKYLISKNGIIKVVVVTLGCIAFTLLAIGGYGCYKSDCASGRTYALAAYVISWSVSVILLLIYVTGLNEKIGEVMGLVDFGWSVFSAILCLTGSIVLSCFLEGNTEQFNGGSRRLASAIFGFFLTIAYIVEAVMLKGAVGSVGSKPTAPEE